MNIFYETVLDCEIHNPLFFNEAIVYKEQDKGKFKMHGIGNWNDMYRLEKKRTKCAIIAYDGSPDEKNRVGQIAVLDDNYIAFL